MTMNISVIGGGRVGLAAAVGFATLGWRVVCYERNNERRGLIAAGKTPFLDIGLEGVLSNVIASGHLRICGDMQSVVTDVQALFIAVPVTDGAGGLDGLFAVIEEVAVTAPKDCLIVIKSTVPPGTCETLQRRFNVHIAMNPEFLREGSGFSDFMSPSRIVVGTDNNDKIKKRLRAIYMPLINKGAPYIETDINSAEISKLAANMFLSARVSLVNEVADLCEEARGDITLVREILSADSRIGGDYLRCGVGFGGACLSKDGRLLLSSARQYGLSLPAVSAVFESNRARPERIVNRILEVFPPSSMIAVWGLAFKPGADSAYDSPAAAVANKLLTNGIKINAYDPAIPVAMRDNVIAAHWFDNPLDTLHGVDGLVVLVFSDTYTQVPAVNIAQAMKGRIVFDCVNMFCRAGMKSAGLTFFALGR